MRPRPSNGMRLPPALTSATMIVPVIPSTTRSTTRSATPMSAVATGCRGRMAGRDGLAVSGSTRAASGDGSVGAVMVTRFTLRARRTAPASRLPADPGWG